MNDFEGYEDYDDFDGRVCEDCREVFDVNDMIYGPDPFNSEIYEDDTPVWLCKECYHDACLDI